MLVAWVDDSVDAGAAEMVSGAEVSTVGTVVAESEGQ